MTARIMMIAGLSVAAMTLVSAAGCGKQETPKTTVEVKKEGETPSKVAQTEKDKGPLPLPPPPMFPPPPKGELPKESIKEKDPVVVKPKPPAVKRERVKPTDTVALTAEAFGGEFRKDADGAARKFEASFVELTGVVSGVGSRDKEPFVTLDAGPESLSILCLLAQEKEPWAKISKGQKIKIRGQWPDFSVQPTLELCTLVELGPNPAQELKAETLAAEFAKNKDAIRKQYADKTLIVTGVLHTAKPRNDLGAISVYLKGPGDVHVDCGFNATDRGEALTLREGATVRVVGEFSLFESNDGPALRGCRVITTK